MTLLIVEDDLKVAATLRKGLVEAGYEAQVCRSAPEAIAAIEKRAFEMILLDLGLIEGDGLDVLQYLKQQKNPIPVLVLTARDSIEDRVIGLDMGADDYLVKPFAFPELLARVRARLRRAPASENVMLSIADLHIDLVSRTATRKEEHVELTPREFDLLVYLVRSAGQMVSRDMLAKDVWKTPSRATSIDNLIDVHMSRLREKIDKGFDQKLIHTVRGVGFVLKEPS